MSSIEERLVRDIAAVTEGVTVTEQHLREARSNLEEHIEIGQQRERRRGFAIVAAAAVVVPVVGVLAFQSLGEDKAAVDPSGTPSEDPSLTQLSVDDLTGVWRVDNGVMLVQFHADGTAQFNDDGGLFGSPSTTAEYEIGDDHLTFTTTRSGTDGPTCAGFELPLKVSLPGDGNVDLVNEATTGGSCMVARPLERWTLERLLPIAEGAEGVTGDHLTFDPLTDPGLLHGDWVAEGGGIILELDDDGGYTVAGGSGDVLDRGRWKYEAEKLSLVSGPDSPSCGDGDRLVMRSVTHVWDGTAFLRGDITTDTCGGTWAKPAWFLLPNAREY
ncbi:MAG TPA: hypothetical protein VFK52_03630 [Nocardioidaceae bacterium]|nr:hypothetical protein [Nocardioidaceae bacterium]